MYVARTTGRLGPYLCVVCGLCDVLCPLVTVSESVFVCLESMSIEFAVDDARSIVHILICRVSFAAPSIVIGANGENVVEG